VANSNYKIHGKTISFMTRFQGNIPNLYQQKENVVLPTRAYIRTMGIYNTDVLLVSIDIFYKKQVLQKTTTSHLIRCIIDDITYDHMWLLFL
jgi:hypothetical protein